MRYLKVFLIVIAGGIVIAIGAFLIPGIRFASDIQSSTTARQREIFYQINHASLADEVRKFADEQRQQTSITERSPLLMWHNDPGLPPCLRIIKCNAVAIFPDHVLLEFGGTFSHFGIEIFDKGTPGKGIRELAEGVWYYADDGRIPKR